MVLLKRLFFSKYFFQLIFELLILFSLNIQHLLCFYQSSFIILQLNFHKINLPFFFLQHLISFFLNIWYFPQNALLEMLIIFLCSKSILNNGISWRFSLIKISLFWIVWLKGRISLLRRCCCKIAIKMFCLWLLHCRHVFFVEFWFTWFF